MGFYKKIRFQGGFFLINVILIGNCNSNNSKLLQWSSNSELLYVV